MMNKKIILFIVEGKTDRIIVETLLHSSYFKQKSEFYIPAFLQVNGDILAASQNKDNNIVGALTSMILKWRKSGQFGGVIKTSDVKEIVQIIDVDGAFIDDRNIIGSEEAGSFVYKSSCIIAYQREMAISRNHKKAKLINKLLSIDQIDNIPYSIYYFSCNMDHVIHNKRNNRTKIDDAYLFAQKCNEDENMLKNTVFSEAIATPYFYSDSWKYIKIGHNSLSRRTNFNLFFTEDAKFAK